MTQPVRAIFEDGVFRPLEPVSLLDRQEVTLWIGDDNLAALATACFGKQGVQLEPHRPVPVRQAPSFEE